MSSEYAHWAERTRQRRAYEQQRQARENQAKPRIIMLRYEGERYFRCETHLHDGRRGFGRTPAEAYESWFNDTIPF